MSNLNAINYRPLSSEEQKNTAGAGGLLTLASVMVVATVGVMSVVAYKIFQSTSGELTLPGGYKFKWSIGK